MLNIKNNFLWNIMEFSKFQDPIEKFDKEFWEKSNEPTKRMKSDENESGASQTNKGISA